MPMFMILASVKTKPIVGSRSGDTLFRGLSAPRTDLGGGEALHNRGQYLFLKELPARPLATMGLRGEVTSQRDLGGLRGSS